VNVTSGVAGTPVVITTRGNTAPGIKALSEGSPSSYNWLPALGIYAPSGPAGGGGPVTVESHSTITTIGGYSHGIFAQNRVGSYNPPVNAFPLVFYLKRREYLTGIGGGQQCQMAAGEMESGPYVVYIVSIA
jgi:hypothetical protein